MMCVIFDCFQKGVLSQLLSKSTLHSTQYKKGIVFVLKEMKKYVLWCTKIGNLFFYAREWDTSILFIILDFSLKSESRI